MVIYQRVYCEEIETDRRIGGIITVDSNDMNVELTSFQQFFVIPESEFMGFKCRDCKYVTFHHPFATQTGSGGIVGGATAYYQKIIASTSIVGNEKWRPEFGVSSISFSMKDMEFKLADFKGDRQYAKSARGAFSGHVLYVESSGMKITIGRNGLFGWLDVSPNVGRSALIELMEPVKFHEYYKKVELIASFVTFLVSESVLVENISVQADIERTENISNYFDVHYVENFDNHNSAGPARALYNVGDSTVRLDIEERLRIWIENEPDWEDAYHLMLEYFRGKRNIRAERLVLVSRWLEAIPTASAKPAISNQEFDSIKQMTSRNIVELSGGRISKERVFGALKILQKERHSQRFERIVKEIRTRFPEFTAPDDMVKHLGRAIDMRGTAAHARLVTPDTESLQNLQLSIAALECLNYLLMAAMFPPSPHVDENILRSISVQSYLFCSMRIQRE